MAARSGSRRAPRCTLRRGDLVIHIDVDDLPAAVAALSSREAAVRSSCDAIVAAAEAARVALTTSLRAHAPTLAAALALARRGGHLPKGHCARLRRLSDAAAFIRHSSPALLRELVDDIASSGGCGRGGAPGCADTSSNDSAWDAANPCLPSESGGARNKASESYSSESEGATLEEAATADPSEDGAMPEHGEEVSLLACARLLPGRGQDVAGKRDGDAVVNETPGDRDEASARHASVSSGSGHEARDIEDESGKEVAPFLSKLERTYKESDVEGLKTCLSTLRIYTKNLRDNPQDPKFKKLKLSNKAFQRRIAHFDGAIGFLEVLGFERKRDCLEQRTCMPDCSRCGQAIKLIDLSLDRV